MNIELPELQDLSAKLDRVLELLTPSTALSDEEIESSHGEILTADEVSQYLRIPKSAVYKMTSGKEIPHLKLGSRLLVRRSEIDEWLDGLARGAIR